MTVVAKVSWLVSPGLIAGLLQAWPCAVLSEEECSLLAPFPHDLGQLVPWNVVCKFQRWLPAQGRRCHPAYATLLNTRPRTPQVKTGAFWLMVLEVKFKIQWLHPFGLW